MDYRSGLLCLWVYLMVTAVVTVTGDGEPKDQTAVFEQALMKEMDQILENKKKGKSDDESKSELSAAMERVKHLKPENMSPQDLIGVMGRVMQAKMGLNVGIQTQNPDGSMGGMPGEDDKKSKKKKKKKTEKGAKKRKGPSLSKSGEL